MTEDTKKKKSSVLFLPRSVVQKHQPKGRLLSTTLCQSWGYCQLLFVSHGSVETAINIC